MIYIFRPALLFLLLFVNSAPAQITPGTLKEFILSDEHMGKLDLSDKKNVREFYAAFNYSFAWMDHLSKTNKSTLGAILKTADRRGLNEQDYQFDFINTPAIQSGIIKSSKDTLEAEIRFSDAAIHFFSDIVYGNTRPLLSYYGLDYKPSCYSIPPLLADYSKKKKLDELLLRLESEPSLPEIKALISKIARLEEMVKSENYRDENIISTAANTKNKPLLRKLYFLGVTDSINITIDKEVKEKVKEAQWQFNLLADGIMRKTFLDELKVPLTTRLKQLKLSLNYYRWLNCLAKEQQVVVVNIPAAYLKVYNKENVILEMRMIVGKPSTHTPTLSSIISEVILYPYWMVPHSIATKELLPAIKRNAGYIDANNFQVLNRQGKIVNPYKVNWTSFSVSNFPYIIRQSTGCDNALGLIKLNFYNPFSVYLHDTPDKSLFMLNKRFFSHGCMRMEKPMELGHLVLKNNPIAIDTLEEKGCLRNQSPITVMADVQLPVVVWYNPAGVDSIGRVVYYPDIYNKLKWMK